jgi:hypothetical protein
VSSWAVDITFRTKECTLSHNVQTSLSGLCTSLNSVH